LLRKIMPDFASRSIGWTGCRLTGPWWLVGQR
jgi:hypothetical protein